MNRFFIDCGDKLRIISFDPDNASGTIVLFPIKLKM